MTLRISYEQNSWVCGENTSLLIRNLYLFGLSGNSRLYLANRLRNCVISCNWKLNIIKSNFDELGLEQGGVNSSDLYKIYNNELLETIQNLSKELTCVRILKVQLLVRLMILHCSPSAILQLVLNF